MKIRTLKGREIDITAIRETQGATIAVGNARMNGHGDLIGRGGTVVKSQDQMTREYYANNPKAVTTSPISLKDISEEIVMTPREAVEALEKKAEEAKAASKRKLRETDD